MEEGERGLFSSFPRLAKQLLQIAGGVLGGSSSSSIWVGIAEDLKLVKTMWEWIEARLSDAEAKEIKYESVKLWLRELRKLSYDAQDLLDSCRYEQLRLEAAVAVPQAGYLLLEVPAVDLRTAKRSNSIHIEDWEVRVHCKPKDPSFQPGSDFRQQMEEGVRTIKRRFEELRYHKDALQLREDDGERVCDNDENAKRWQTGSCPTDLKLFGRADDLRQLVHDLINDDMGEGAQVAAAVVQVIAVVGMGGVGKTALAQHACNDGSVRRHFDARGWVCVREHFDLVRLTKAAVETFAVNNRDATAQDQWASRTYEEVAALDPLQAVLSEAIRGKKFLLVLDDVWNECSEHWDRFLSPLRNGAKGSKIIITTRNHAVANATAMLQSKLQLGCLPLEASRLLFRRCAFHGRDDPRSREPEFQQAADGIIRKTGGLPLALKVLGRFLRHESDIELWRYVMGSDLCEAYGAGNQILEPLESSYLHLGTSLKACFRFWALFPEDHHIHREEVIRLWMAHDLVHDKNGLRLEDVGFRYVKELCSRSLFQPLPCGNQLTMHPVVHELARRISGVECQRIVDGQPSRHLTDEASHLGIWGSSCNLGEMNAKLSDPLFCNNILTNLRSLLLSIKLDSAKAGFNVIHLPNFHDMKSLRVLDLSNSCIEDLPCSIASLKHLRYLKLTGTGIKKLPESVSMLFNLRALDLGSVCGLDELPSTIGNLKHLRYLNLQNTKIDTLPESIRLLSDLQHPILCRSLNVEFPTSRETMKERSVIAGID